MAAVQIARERRMEAKQRREEEQQAKEEEEEERRRQQQQAAGSNDSDGDEETDDETDDEDDYGPSPAAGIWAGSQKLQAETAKIEDEAAGGNDKGDNDGQQPTTKKARHE